MKIVLGVATVVLLFSRGGPAVGLELGLQHLPQPERADAGGDLCGTVAESVWRGGLQTGGLARRGISVRSQARCCISIRSRSALDSYCWGWHPVVGVGDPRGAAIILSHRTGGVLFSPRSSPLNWRRWSRQNCWDYVVDPFFWMVSLGFVSGRAFRDGGADAATWGGERVGPAEIGRRSVRIFAPRANQRCSTISDANVSRAGPWSSIRTDSFIRRAPSLPAGGAEGTGVRPYTYENRRECAK